MTVPNEFHIRVMTWNIAGSRYFEADGKTRGALRRKLNNKLRRFADVQCPHFILLQEIVRYGNRRAPIDLVKPPPGYCYEPTVSVDTHLRSHPRKWNRYRKHWPPGTYLTQGCGILWREDILHAPLWEFSGAAGESIEKEVVHMNPGLYAGDRDTEPRLAVVTRFIFDVGEKPLDVFVVNTHLTTLKGEREGFPAKDEAGSRMRLGQIDLILERIVTRHTAWRRKQPESTGRARAVWIIAGDFNCTPASPEIAKMKRLRFVDLNDDKGDGTKAGMCLDYIFAGPDYYALDHALVESQCKLNPSAMDSGGVSDHSPVFAQLPVRPIRDTK